MNHFLSTIHAVMNQFEALLFVAGYSVMVLVTVIAFGYELTQKARVKR